MIKELINKKKLVIFDLDGVLINSKTNMNISWNYAAYRSKLNISFKSYFKLIGFPFHVILKKLKIDQKKYSYKKIHQDFSQYSIKHINKIKLYNNVKQTLKKIKSKKKIIAILTSKDCIRCKKILKKFNFYFNHIECGNFKKKGKPNPYQLNLILKKFRVLRKEAVYIGDMIPDYLTANNAKIDFIYANYGYGKFNIKNNYKINKIEQLV